MTIFTEMFDEHNYEKAYEEAHELANDMNIVLAEPRVLSHTFADNKEKFLKIFYTNISVFINHYENIVIGKEDSTVQK